MSDFIDPLDLALRVPIVLLALTVHEFAHAYAAYRLGDPTAMRLGRCTLNPLKHLDPLGTICLMFAPIGWAKPVPVNPLNFEDRRKGDLITSAAGPASNLAQAIVFCLILRLIVFVAGGLTEVFGEDARLGYQAAGLMCLVAVFINVGLAVFNCLPLFPLDGFHITLQLMKPSSQERFQETAAYGPFVIIGLVILGRAGGVNILKALIEPPVDFLLRHVAGLGI